MIDKSQITGLVTSFPTLPVFANRLLEVASNPDAGSADLAQVIALDFALSANVLRAANSAYFGFAKPAATVDDAIFRLGAGWIFQLAMLNTVSSAVKKPAPAYGQSAEDLWKHSVGVAATADNLCRLLKLRDSRTVFTAAIIHDIGKLILETFIPDHLDKIQQLVAVENVSFQEAERSLIGFDHAEVGALIAEHWHFPTELIQAVRWHHCPNSAGAGQHVVDIVHAADSICLLQGIGLGYDGISYRFCSQAFERLNLSATVLETASSMLLDSLDGIESVLSNSATGVKVGG